MMMGLGDDLWGDTHADEVCDYERRIEELEAKVTQLNKECDSLANQLNQCNERGGKILAENERLHKCCTQRGARMQIMREWMEGFEAGSLWNGSVWDALCESRRLRKPDLWFDADGVPK